MRILIIDDNPTLLNIFAKFLEIKGFSVTTETTFKAGLQHFKNESYDVLFVDSPLDDYADEQILTDLKENQIFQKSNVFLFSSVDFDDVELDAWKKDGLYSYLKKPVKRSTIINALDTINVKRSLTSETLSESIVSSDQATPEQIEKLNQLQKQIEELENVLHVSSFNQKNLKQKTLIDRKTKSITTIRDFKTIINDLRSLQSTFDFTGHSTKKSSSKSSIEKNEIMEQELKQILFEVSEIKDELQLRDKINNSELKYTTSLSNLEKKPKTTKKHTRSGSKKPKTTKKL